MLVASFVRRANGAWGQLYSPCSTRASKKAIAPDADMFAEWARRADAVGLSTGNIAALLDQEQVREMRWFDVETVRELLGRGERGLTAQASVRTRNRRSRARTSRRG